MWKTIRSYNTLIEAEIARSKLEASNIDCFLHDTHTIGLQSFLANALGGVRLDVKEEDVAEAIALLDEDFSSELN